MVVFRACENINIKTTDGTLVKYSKLKNPSNLFNETVYITTYEDFLDLKRVFSNVGVKYKAKVIDEHKIRTLSQFPIELGISNINEYNTIQNLDFKYKNKNFADEKELNSLYLEEYQANLEEQIKGVFKKDISIAVLGRLGNSISEMICACTALRILYERLNKKFRSVRIDVYLNASENSFYTRDKMIFANQPFINNIHALSIDVKRLCEYDFFIDTSSVSSRSYYKHLKHIDAWLYKFGIDYKNIDDSLKYNTINISSYKARKELKELLENLKLKGKIVLFHPYSANITKSIPKEVASNLLKNLLLELPDYTIASAIKLDNGKFDSDRFVDLSGHSKSYLDFCYIISNMSKIITVNTATYHIADAFFIPTVVILTDYNKEENVQTYESAKMVYVRDKSKNFSQFVFENDTLLLYKFEGWNQLKSSKIIRLLESF